MAGGGGGDSQTLQETPTWALAAVCGVFIAISIWFKKKQKKAMMEALEKIKAELMLLGFISLLLTVSTTLVARICIPPHFAHTWLPCPHDSYNRRRLLLSFNVTGDVLHRRFLAGVDDEKDYCGSRILVLTGTKLELVIMEMAQQIQDKTNVVRGAPIVEPTNDFFWFSKPHWILS
nr:MLO protein homolog 1-like [Ipomoea batatas]